jgi:GTP cyclohydrolase I
MTHEPNIEDLENDESVSFSELIGAPLHLNIEGTTQGVADLVFEHAQFNELQAIGRRLLEVLQIPIEGETLETPKRWAKWWMEFMNYDPGKVETSFSSNRVDQMVVITIDRIWSLCSHHLLPWYADVTIGYIPNQRVLGLSKFARIAQKHAHKPQTQEQFVDDIAEEISRLAGTKNVAVVARGEHLCMISRGIKAPGKMMTSSMKGAFRHEGSTRREFFSLMKLGMK